MTALRAILILILWLAALVPLAMAQPDPHARVGRTVADSELPGYRFERLQVVTADGQRRYRVHLAVPRAAAPPAGYPVAYLLDGNAALMELDADLLQRLAESAHPPVLALIAHDNDLRIDGDARTFDYTPRRTGARGEEFDVLNAARRSGGADAFLSFIEGQIKLAVAAKVAVDAGRQLLWGHSYGGLFALHVLATRPAAFSDYAAVDPSLWWGEGFIVDELESLEALAAREPEVSARLLLIRGGPSPEATPASSPAGPQFMREQGNAKAAERLRKLLPALGGLQVRQLMLPGKNHGQTLGAGIAPALEAFAEERRTTP